MYQAVRTYTLLPETSEEFLRRVHESFVPLISQLPGFIAYNTKRIGNDQVVTISTFDTRTGAEESILFALRWVQENTLELMQGLPVLTMAQVSAASVLLVSQTRTTVTLTKRWCSISGLRSFTQVSWASKPILILTLRRW